MNLVIDIGNTSSKVAIFENNQIVKKQVFNKLHLADILSFASGIDITSSIISSVKEFDEDLQSIISHFNALILTHKTDLPIKSSYKTPETLGKDRLAAIVGAENEFSNKNILLIDVGTCITFDYYIDGIYTGGRISPGIQMRYNALHTSTDKLPQINLSDEHFRIGEDTNSSIIAGVQQGVIDEIDTGVDTFLKENKETAVIFCGGDYKFFVEHLKNRIFASPFIVLKGLNIILEFNAKK